jgi:hypothetical protein
MTDSTGSPDPKRSETDPPAANQPLSDEDLGPAAESQPRPTHEEDHDAEPAPTPVPVAAPHGGQIPPGKPDGEVDTRA